MRLSILFCLLIVCAAFAGCLGNDESESTELYEQYYFEISAQNTSGEVWEVWMPLSIHVQPGEEDKTSEVIPAILAEDERLSVADYNSTQYLVFTAVGDLDQITVHAIIDREGPFFEDGERIVLTSLDEYNHSTDSDEQQYDASGDRINWFDCQDSSQIWIDQVNDGTEDCPDGEDEGGSDGGYGGNLTFVCGVGSEIPFSYVNDGWENCDREPPSYMVRATGHSDIEIRLNFWHNFQNDAWCGGMTTNFGPIWIYEGENHVVSESEVGTQVCS